MFSGKAYYNDHNSDGFRGEEFKNSKSDVFQIAFFGGSTGYNGDPPIDKLIENILKKIISKQSHLIFHLYHLIITNTYIAF